MVSIQSATEDHVEGVFQLASSYLLSKKLRSTDSPRDGFLVSGYSEDQYAELVTQANLFSVALGCEQVIGFVLAYSSDRVVETDWMGQRLLEHVDQPFVVIKQICAHADFTGKGVAAELYRHLFGRTDKPLFAAIVLEPKNERSISFHERLGFTKAADAIPPDGIPRGLWARGYPGQLGSLSSG